MATKIILVLLLFLVSGFGGYSLGRLQAHDKTEKIKDKIVKSIDLDKKIDVKSLGFALAPPSTLSKKNIQHVAIKENYLKNYLEENENKKIFNKAIGIFNDTRNKEGLALWIILGTSFDNSKEYTTLYENSLSKLNENPEETLDSINRKIASLGEEDDFIRVMLNNLVNNLNLENSLKIGFFGNELNRPISVGKDGGMGEGFNSVINSLIFLKQYAKDLQEVKEIFDQSLTQNTKPREREALRLRFLTYYPELKGEI